MKNILYMIILSASVLFNRVATGASRTSQPHETLGEGSNSGLVLWNRLGSTNEVQQSVVGDYGTLNAGRFVPGRFGNALELNMQQEFGATFPIGALTNSAGCLEFWAKMDDFPSVLPTGASPGLIGCGMPGQSDGFVLFFSANDGNAKGGLCVRSALGVIGTGGYGYWTYSAAIGGNIADWHHYAVTWNATGIPGVGDGTRKIVTYVDGGVNSSRNTFSSASRFVDLPPTGRFGLLNHQTLVNGRIAFDNLKVWNYAKTDFSDRLEEGTVDPAPYTLSVLGACGNASPANGEHTVFSGNSITASVPASVTEGTTRYVCTGATVTGNDYAQPEPARVTLTLTNNATLTWNWQTQRRLTVRTEGDGSVSAAGEWQNDGTNVALTAAPAAHALFAGWQGDTNACLMQGGTITAPMTQARALTAVFRPKTPLVTFDPQGGAVSPDSKVVTFGTAYGFLPDPSRAGHIFNGWRASTNGVVFGVASDSVVSVFSDHTLRADWIEDPILSPPEDTAAFSSPGSYDGFLYSEDAFGGTAATSVRGTLSLKITSLTGKLTAKAVVRTGPLSFSSQKWPSTDTNGTCHASLSARGGETLDLYVSQDRIWGTLAGGTFGAGALSLDGARNRFDGREDAAAQRLLDAYRGYYTVALPPAGALSPGDANAAPGGSGYLTLTVGNGGGVKIAGKLADGTPVSQSGRLIPFDGDGPVACVPFFVPLYARKGWAGGLLWIDPSSRAVVTDRYLGWFIRWENPGAGPDGFSELLDACGGYYGTAPSLGAHYFFSAAANDSPCPYAGGMADLQSGALPNAIRVTADGPRLTMTRGTRPPLADGAYDYSAENSSMATLTFSARTGIFKGRFSLYYDYTANKRLKHKAITVSYAGVLTPVRAGDFADQPAGQGHYLVPDSTPALKAYRIKRSYQVWLDAAP